jgi:hypothetical protein
MHEPLFSRAALPAPAAVCGIPLRPYSLGHELFLIRELNPFVTGEEVLPGDLMQAVWVCSSTFEECRDAHASWLYLLKVWLVSRRIKKCDFKSETTAFRAYRADGSLEFKLSEIATPNNAPTPRPAGAPWLLRLHQFMVSQYRLTISQAWDFPLGEAKMRWASFWEQEGGLNIYNEHDASFDAYIAEQEAKGAKQCQA